MRNRVFAFLYLAVFSLVFCINKGFAQSWKMLGGPTEVSIVDVQVANDSLYVITGDGSDRLSSLGGIFKRALDSNDWKFSSIQGYDFLSLAMDNDGTY